MPGMDGVYIWMVTISHFFIGDNISKPHSVYNVIFLAYFSFNLSLLRDDEEIILIP